MYPWGRWMATESMRRQWMAEVESETVFKGSPRFPLGLVTTRDQHGPLLFHNLYVCLSSKSERGAGREWTMLRVVYPP